MESLENIIYDLVRAEIKLFENTLSPDEIAKSLEEFNPEKHKMIKSSNRLWFSEYKHITDLGILEVIDANQIYFEESYFNSLKNLRIIRGDINFQDILDIGNLTMIGGSVGFGESKIQNLKNLKFISGDASFRNSVINNLGNLTIVGGNATFSNSEIENLNNLLCIGGDANFNDSKVTNVGKLKFVVGWIRADNENSRALIRNQINKNNEGHFIKKDRIYYLNEDGVAKVENFNLDRNKRYIINSLENLNLDTLDFMITNNNKSVTFYSDGDIRAGDPIVSIFMQDRLT